MSRGRPPLSAADHAINRMIGMNVSRERTARGISQQALAREAQIAQSAISQMESGRGAGLSVPSLTRVAGALGVPVGLLFQEPKRCPTCDQYLPPSAATAGDASPSAADDDGVPRRPERLNLAAPSDLMTAARQVAADLGRLPGRDVLLRELRKRGYRVGTARGTQLVEALAGKGRTSSGADAEDRAAVSGEAGT